MSDTYHILPDFVAFAVPLRIWDYKAKGGPAQTDFDRCQEYSSQLGAHGDALLFHVKGQTAAMMDILLDAIAILSFVPGGITIFGCHFEEVIDDKRSTPTETR